MTLFASLRGFRRPWLARDGLAGLPPQAGLFAFVAGTLGFAALGANRLMSVGADSTTAPIFAGALAAFAAADPAHYPAMTAQLALAVGVLLAAAGLARGGWVADLLSAPVTAGFLAGIAVHIVVGQLPALLGLTIAPGYLLERLGAAVAALPRASPPAACLGLGAFALILLAARVGPHVPGPLIAVIAAALALPWLDPAGTVARLGALPATLPDIAAAFSTPMELRPMLLLAPTIALVCMMQTAVVAGRFPSDAAQPDDLSRDFLGVGAGCLLAGMAGGFVVNASPPSTAVVAGAGGRSQLACLFAAGLVALLLAFGGGLMAHVPVPAVAAVLITIGVRLVNPAQMRRIAREGGVEFGLVVAACLLVVLLPIELGMALAILLSMLHSIYTLARPVCSELVRLPGTTVWWPPGPHEHGEREPGIVVFAPAAPINFTNAGYVRARLLAILAAAPPPVRLVVIEASGVAVIDYTGGQILQRLVVQLRAQGIDVAMARMGAERARRTAARSGLLAKIGPDHLFHSVEEAVRRLG